MIKVFVKEGKIIATEIEGAHMVKPKMVEF